jgi:hypothetical protein
MSYGDDEYIDPYANPGKDVKEQRRLETLAFKRLRESIFKDKYSEHERPFMEICGRLPISFDDEEFIMTLCVERWTPMSVRLFYYNSGNSQSFLAALHSIGVMDDAELTPKELDVAERLYNIAQARKHQRISDKLENGFMDEKVAKVLLENYYGTAKQPANGGVGLGQAVELHISPYVPPEKEEPPPAKKTGLKEVL